MLAAKKDIEIVASCRNTEKGLERLGGRTENVKFIQWEMARPVSLPGDIDAIIHIAGRGDPAAYASAAFTTMRDNFLGCVNLLDFAIANRIGRIVFVSSGEVYGTVAGNDRIKEKEQGSVPATEPRSCYPIGKMACESLCLAAGREYELAVSVARLCHVYGPGASADDPRIAVRFPLVAARGEDIVLKSSGSQLRSFCFIEDAAVGILTVLARGLSGELYNIADENTELTVREFAEKTAILAGVKVIFDIPSATEQSIFNPMPRAVFSAAKLAALGWSPETTFETGMQRALTQFRHMFSSRS